MSIIRVIMSLLLFLFLSSAAVVAEPVLGISKSFSICVLVCVFEHESESSFELLCLYMHFLVILQRKRVAGEQLSSIRNM